MLCPCCKDTQLVMSERKGIEIDYCPQCRGVWLDRGELDKIIEKSAAEEQKAAPQQQQYQNHGKHYGQDHQQKPYKKKSFLFDLFD